MRMIIYKELLNPEPGKPLALHHDQTGRDKVLNIHPSILQVDRQIYCEASPILYDLNIFEIDLSSMVVRYFEGTGYPGTRTDHHLPLFRSDTAPNNLPVKPNGRYVSVRTSSSGLIYTHCFQRLRHLELVTSHGAVWGPALLPNFLSKTGELVQDVLRCLAKRVNPDGQHEKTLKVTTRLSTRRPEMRVFSLEESDTISRMSEDGGSDRKKLKVLLWAVNKQRKVTVIEVLDP
ncbi:hypothetical protein MMC18_005702 [Xylographa bjoerkii]|nr:hypothetical protein [Xylographa bjoerkii]